MSQPTKHEGLAKQRRSCLRADAAYQRQLLDQVVALFGYHREAAICAQRDVPEDPATANRMAWPQFKTLHQDRLGDPRNRRAAFPPRRHVNGFG